MQTTAMVPACRALTITGRDQVCTSSLPEAVTVLMSGERPVT